MDYLDLASALDSLRQREGIPPQRGDLVGRWVVGQQAPMTIPDLPKWAESRGIASVIWTALTPKFAGEENRTPSVEEPTAHWLEYVDWAEPILQQPVKIQDGRALASDAPGVGVAWNEAAVERYRAP